MNIYEKIAAIMQDVQYLAKDDHVSFGSTSYKALSEEKVTSIMRAEMLKHKLVVFPISQVANRTGNITHVDVVYRMVNVENPEESIEIASCGDGADTQDKGSGKAMTYAFKYRPSLDDYPSLSKKTNACNCFYTVFRSHLCCREDQCMRHQ